MLSAEAEFQFIKIIRTRIVDEARRTIQHQIFNSATQLTKYLKQIYGSSKKFIDYKENWIVFIKKTNMLHMQIG